MLLCGWLLVVGLLLVKSCFAMVFWNVAEARRTPSVSGLYWTFVFKVTALF